MTRVGEGEKISGMTPVFLGQLKIYVGIFRLEDLDPK